MAQASSSDERDPGDEDDGERMRARRMNTKFAMFRVTPGESIHLRTPAQRRPQ